MRSKKESINEEDSLYRKPDHKSPEWGWGRTSGQGCLPWIRYIDATYYNWKSKYDGLTASGIKKLNELEDENQRLKRMYSEFYLSLKLTQYII